MLSNDIYVPVFYSFEQDLLNIYGGFVNWDDDLEKNMYVFLVHVMYTV